MLVSIIEITYVFSQNLAEISSGTQHNLGSGEGGEAHPREETRTAAKTSSGKIGWQSWVWQSEARSVAVALALLTASQVFFPNSGLKIQNCHLPSSPSPNKPVKYILKSATETEVHHYTEPGFPYGVESILGSHDQRSQESECGVDRRDRG